MVLIKGMTEQEIRVLQEFRRLGSDSVPLATIKSIKHPTGGGEAPALSLLTKGYLQADEARESFALTEKAKEFLAYDPVPEFEGGGVAEDAEAEAVE